MPLVLCVNRNLTESQAAATSRQRSNGNQQKHKKASLRDAVEIGRLELVNVIHAYQHEKDDSHFVLGPINLRFHPGELIFIVGGNGSGKSTLAKIVAGLYVPEAGEIRLDGAVITDRNRDDYRQLFSAVFSDFYLFDKEHRLVYRGQFDDSRPGNGVPVTGTDLRAAIDAVLAGKPASANQEPSIGCNIKWKAGNEPEYFS